MIEERVILFDLGKVLIDFDHNIAVRRIQHLTRLDQKSIYNLFFDSGITDKFEKGNISSLDFFQEVKQILGISISYEDFIPVWNEIFSPHPHSLEIIDSLKNNYRLYLVSNINQMHLEYLQRQFSEYFNYFSYIFLSYEMGLRKPDLRIYERIIDYIKLPAKNIIYTDDRLELIEAAQKLGIDAFVFKSIDSLKEELSKRNIQLDLAEDRQR
jgi:putative hydrolase of the HAD superfamily